MNLTDREAVYAALGEYCPGKGDLDAASREIIDPMIAEIERLRAALCSIAYHNMNDSNVPHTVTGLRRLAVDALEQQPPLIHVGRNGEAHDGPRDECTICWNDGRR